MSPLLVTTVLAAAATPGAGGGVPNPGGGTVPPGAEGLVTILGWAAWIVFALAVLGILFTAAIMVVSVRRDQGGEHVARLGWVLAGCVLGGAASGLVGALALA